jgi:CRP/FNR family transcriptional regulator
VAEVHRATAQAIEDSRVAVIDKQAAAELIACQPRFAMEVSRRIGEDQKLLVERLLAMAYGNVRRRLAGVLWELGERHGVKCSAHGITTKGTIPRAEEGILIDLPLSQQDLADLVGASRQKVNQKLRRLADQGLIRIERCRITILDLEGLRRLR